MKRALMAVPALALVLALSGCGGSGDGGKSGSASAASSPAASAPAPSPSAAPGSASGKGEAGAPTPPAQSKATKAFRACMRKQGVELPSPNPTSTPAKKDLEKIKAALQACVKSMSESPGAKPN